MTSTISKKNLVKTGALVCSSLLLGILVPFTQARADFFTPPSIIVSPIPSSIVPPGVSAVTLSASTVEQNASVTYSGTAYDSSGISSCYLTDIPVSGASMPVTVASGRWTVTAPAMYVATYHPQVTCTYGSGATVAGAASATLTVTPPGGVAPGISAVTMTPSTVTVGDAVTYRASAFFAAGISSCTLEGLPVSGASALITFPTLTGGIGSVTYPAMYAGTYHVHVHCFYDSSMSSADGPSQDLIVNPLTPPAPPAGVPTGVSAVTLSASTVEQNASVTYSGTAYDPSGITSCYLSDIPVSGASMPVTVTSGRWTVTAPAMYVTTYHPQVTCTYGSGTTVAGAASATLVVTPPGGVAPGISAVTMTPSSVVVGASVTYRATAFFASGITNCTLEGLPVSGASAVITFPTFTGGAGSVSYPAMYTGTYHVHVHCFYDSSMGSADGPSQDLVVSPLPPADTTPPSVSTVSPITAVAGVSTSLSASASDNVGLRECSLFVDGSSAGIMGISGGTVSLAYTFLSAGSHTASAHCLDSAGNIGIGPTQTMSVSAAPTAPSTASATAPIITILDPVSPSSIAAGSTITYRARVSVSAPSTLSECTLSVDGSSIGAMDIGPASLSGVSVITNVSDSYTPSTSGPHTAQIQCRNAVGTTYATFGIVTVASPASTSGSTPTSSSAPSPSTPASGSSSESSSGASGSGTATGSTSAPTGPATATPGNLLKLNCPSRSVAADHPCKAVYYFGLDGKRHAFPNEHVYFTWYNDFSRVVSVSDSFMSSLPLGRNVIYRPGVRLVKFTTLNHVYAVTRGRTLRWVTTEEAARTLYGDLWATKKVDDISDIFFTDYTFGSDITSASMYNPSAETAAAGTIDAAW